MKVTAIVVARKGSKRIVEKNYQRIGTETLIERKLRQLKECPEINQVILGSDDVGLRETAESAGAEFVRRPDEFCDEVSKTPNDMIKNMLSLIQPTDVIVWAHCTNPFIGPNQYEQAINAYKDNFKKGFDSTFSATELHGHFWSGESESLRPLNFSTAYPIHKVAKDLPGIYVQNGGIFVRDFKEMKQDGQFIGRYPMVALTDKIMGLDIDYQEDLDYARFLYAQKTGQTFTY